MIDLHIHSNCSDGSDDWKTILQKAQERGLTCISITDHDNCDVYGQMTDTQEYFSGEIITGIEMQACFEGISLELLGYGFDVEKMREQLKGLYVPFETLNRIEFERFYECCCKMGVKFCDDVLSGDTSKYHYATEYLLEKMREFPENRAFVPDDESWEKENIFFRRHISNPQSPFYIDESDLVPPVEKVVDAIRNAGGKVFIAHIFQYGDNAQMILDGLCACVDGIECYYPTFSKEQSRFLVEFCKARGLEISGGSDYHGKNRPGVELGVDYFIT